MAAVAGEVTAPLHRRRLRQGRSRLTRIPPIIWVFLGLGTVMEAFWVAWPTLNTFYYSFTQWDGIGKKVWVGLGNYRGLLHDPVFGKALLDNCIWLVGFGGLSLSFGLIFALALDKPRRGVGVYRALIYLPLVFSLVVTGLFWQTLYKPSGPLDSVLNAIGLRGVEQQWLTQPHLVLYSLLVAAIWHEVGYVMVLYLAGLKATDPELAQASQVDGANGLQRLAFVTLPQLREVNLIVLAIVVIDSLRTFDIVWVMTGGGPNNASQLLSVDMYTEAFTDLQLGYASAIAVVIFLLTIGFVMFLVSRMVRADR
ncbi:MAG: sugar ABC transporter permease [Acidimicrobiales bacterium]